jgi:hypothetical protein
MDYMNPKSPSDLPKSEHLRRQARELKGRAERLIEEADGLLAEADRLEKAGKKKHREDFSQAATQVAKEAMENR